jgi:hypothetical protein
VRRCSQQTAAGKPCKSWAVAGTDRCAAHLRLAGRKTKLTEQLTVHLCGLLEGGVPLPSALAAVGLGRRTYYDWLDRAEPLYLVFRERVEQARGLGEATLVARIAQASTSNWQAAAFLLERGAPERWARVSQRKEEGGEAAPPDPFAEFDELAARRHRDAG